MSASASITVEEIAANQSSGAIKSKANYIQAQSKGLEDEAVHQQTASSLSNLQDQINTQGRSIRILASAIVEIAPSPVPPFSTDGIISYA